MESTLPHPRLFNEAAQKAAPNSADAGPTGAPEAEIRSPSAIHQVRGVGAGAARASTAARAGAVPAMLTLELPGGDGHAEHEKTRRRTCVDLVAGLGR